MGDRVGCTLNVWGIITQNNFREICGVIDHEFGGGVADLMEELTGAQTYFEDIDGGDLPNNIAQALIAAGLGYSWEWGSGAEFQSGYTVHDIETGTTYTNLMVGYDVHVPLDRLDDQEFVQRIRNGAAANKRSADLPFIVTQSSHEYVEAIKKHPHLASRAEASS